MELDRRLSQAINWAHRKKIDLAAGAVLSAAAFACSGGNGKSETNPTPPGPDIPPVATATQVPPTEVPPTPTPEKPALSFAHYDVFTGDIEGGGKIVIVILFHTGDSQSPKVIAMLEKTDKCTDPTYYSFLFTAAAPLNLNAQDFEVAGGFSLSRKVSGKLDDASTVSGNISGPQAGTCPASPDGGFIFTAKKVGNGKDVFLQAAMSAYAAGRGNGSVNGTAADFQNSIERQTKIKLPEN